MNSKVRIISLLYFHIAAVYGVCVQKPTKITTNTNFKCNFCMSQGPTIKYLAQNSMLRSPSVKANLVQQCMQVLGSTADQCFGLLDEYTVKLKNIIVYKPINIHRINLLRMFMRKYHSIQI